MAKNMPNIIIPPKIPRLSFAPDLETIRFIITSANGLSLPPRHSYHSSSLNWEQNMLDDFFPGVFFYMKYGKIFL